MLPTDHGFPAHNSQYSDTAESARRGERQCWAEARPVMLLRAVWLLLCAAATTAGQDSVSSFVNLGTEIHSRPVRRGAAVSSGQSVFILHLCHSFRRFQH